MIRKLCYMNHITEFHALPSGRRWEAAMWVTVNEDRCEECHPELLEAELEPEEKTDNADESTP